MIYGLGCCGPHAELRAMSSSSSSSVEVAHHGASDSCLNCGVLLMPKAKFCHACGQDTANHPPSLFEFVHEFVAHYVALEGALWRSLKGLAFRPGFLTVEYLAGRKARYVLPLRLLLTLGFVFFLLVKVVPSESASPNDAAAAADVADEEVDTAPPDAASASASTAIKVGDKTLARPSRETASAASQASSAIIQINPDAAPVQALDLFPSFLRPQVEAAKQRWSKDSTAESDRLLSKVRGLMPYAVLGSLPLFAGMLSLVFWWRRQTYGAHFVFAMHLHAFFYLGLTILIMPLGQAAMGVLAWLMLYPVLAIKRVYTHTWWRALVSSAVVFFLHILLLLAMLMAVFAIGALAP